MWGQLMETSGGRTATLLRVVLGLVMLPHGAQKLFGWFGGLGFAGTVEYFQQGWSIPAIVTVLVIIAEFFGALALIAGFMTRFSAASIAVVMLGAIYFETWQFGFFMNWFGQQAGEGIEYHVLAIAQALALVLLGGGWLSMDDLLHRRRRFGSSVSRREVPRSTLSDSPSTASASRFVS